MSNWEEDDDRYCTSAEDFQDARRVCEVLGIPLHRVSFAREYRDRVFEYFLREYAAGRTPNPDVLCNREIKFGACLEYARRLGADLFATGHYARIASTPAGPRLCKARDANKDQTYFLHGIDRAGAAYHGVPARRAAQERSARASRARRRCRCSTSRDSTGICFIGERPFREFLATYLPARPGAIESEDGRTLGEHQGLMYLHPRSARRPGDRRARGFAEAVWYVAGKDLARNVLHRGAGPRPSALLSSMRCTPRNVTGWRRCDRRFRCAVKTRYRQADQPCEVQLEGACAQVTFDTPQRAVTPGQFVVFYDGEVCLGGAIIASTRPLAGHGAPLARSA